MENVRTPRQVIALEIIAAGRKALAKAYHPDGGGTHDKFLMMTDAVKWLQKLVDGEQPATSQPIVVPQSTMTREERDAELYYDDAPIFSDMSGEL